PMASTAIIYHPRPSHRRNWQLNDLDIGRSRNAQCFLFPIYPVCIILLLRIPAFGRSRRTCLEPLSRVSISDRCAEAYSWLPLINGLVVYIVCTSLILLLRDVLVTHCIRY